jgi:5'-nucleotidase
MNADFTMRRRDFLGAAGAAIGTAALSTAVGQRAYASENAVESDPDRYVNVQLVNITDLHGYLQPTDLSGYNLVNNGSQQLTVGGAAYLAANLKRIRAGQAHSIFFSSGDNFSGWPFEVDALANEPTVEVLNKLGLQFSTVGNHELDQRFPEFLLEHMEKGTPYSKAGRDDSFIDSTGRRFHGADFPFYTSNIVYTDSGFTVVPPYNIVWVTGPRGKKLPIGFIHLTVPDAPTGSTSYQPALRSLDSIATVNKYAAILKKKGVNAIVVNMHDGGVAGKDINGLTSPTGPCFDLAAQASPDISAIVTGHWHEPFNGMLPDPAGNLRPVVEAGCHGQMINEINLKLHPITGEVIRALTTSINHPNTHDVPPDPEMQATVNYWVDAGIKRWVQPLAKQTGDFTRAATQLGESTMGDLGADVLYWDANQAGDHVDLALFATAPRTGSVALAGDGLLQDAGASTADKKGLILFGEAWNAFGYGNPVLGVTLTGAEVHAALEGQWLGSASGGESFAPLAVSANVRYSVDLTQPIGSRILPADVRIDGQPLAVGRDYRVAALAYTLIGADGTTALTAFRDPVRHDRDREGFMNYLRLKGTVAPAPTERVQPKS